MVVYLTARSRNKPLSPQLRVVGLKLELLPIRNRTSQVDTQTNIQNIIEWDGSKWKRNQYYSFGSFFLENKQIDYVNKELHKMISWNEKENKNMKMGNEMMVAVWYWLINTRLKSDMEEMNIGGCLLDSDTLYATE